MGDEPSLLGKKRSKYLSLFENLFINRNGATFRPCTRRICTTIKKIIINHLFNKNFHKNYEEILNYFNLYLKNNKTSD
jgi:hypothetical protein